MAKAFTEHEKMGKAEAFVDSAINSEHARAVIFAHRKFREMDRRP